MNVGFQTEDRSVTSCSKQADAASIDIYTPRWNMPQRDSADRRDRMVVTPSTKAKSYVKTQNLSKKDGNPVLAPWLGQKAWFPTYSTAVAGGGPLTMYQGQYDWPITSNEAQQYFQGLQTARWKVHSVLNRINNGDPRVYAAAAQMLGSSPYGFQPHERQYIGNVVGSLARGISGPMSIYLSNNSELRSIGAVQPNYYPFAGTTLAHHPQTGQALYYGDIALAREYAPFAATSIMHEGLHKYAALEDYGYADWPTYAATGHINFPQPLRGSPWLNVDSLVGLIELASR